MLRRTIPLVVVLAAALLAARSVGSASGASDLGRAREAYASLQRYFGRPGRLQLDAYPGRRASSAWSLSQTLAATLGLAEADPRFRADARAELAALAPYRRGSGYMPYPRPPFGSGGYRYYDDNEWLGLDLVRAYRLLGDDASLRRAQLIFAFVTTAWDRDRTHACPGGVFWTSDPGNTDRNTVSTANGALLALDLYRETHVRSYLDWARTMYAWVDRCLLSPDGLYADHLSPAGELDGTEWSYNQGAMIAAGAALFDATGNRSYLASATALARTALARLGGGGFSGEPLVFTAIFFRDLWRLDRVAPSPAYRRAAQRFADGRWRSGRDRATGLFFSSGTATLLDQAAVVDLYAELATS